MFNETFKVVVLVVSIAIIIDIIAFGDMSGMTVKDALLNCFKSIF